MSCGNKQGEEITENLTVIETPMDTTPVTVKEETKFKFDFEITNIPSPVGSIDELSKWGVDYNNTLLADSKKQLSTSQ